MLSGGEISVLSNLLQNVVGELVAHVFETLAGRVRRGRVDRLLLEEEVAPISARLARELLEAGLREHPEIEEADWESALLRLREAIRSARGTGMDPVLVAGLRSEQLSRILTEHGALVGDSLPVASGAHRAYEWLLGAVSQRIIEEFELRPDFDTQLAKAILQYVVLTREALDLLIERLPPAPPLSPSPSSPPFEHRYLDHVARSLGRFELFGVNRGREPSKQSFEESYVSLTVARTSEPDQVPADDEEEELTGAGVAVSNALSGRKRVILRGSAGSGKTTLLNWLAANGAAGRLTGESGPWGEVVPFLVRLRDFTATSPATARCRWSRSCRESPPRRSRASVRRAGPPRRSPRAGLYCWWTAWTSSPPSADPRCRTGSSGSSTRIPRPGTSSPSGRSPSPPAGSATRPTPSTASTCCP